MDLIHVGLVPHDFCRSMFKGLYLVSFYKRKIIWALAKVAIGWKEVGSHLAFKAPNSTSSKKAT